MTFDDSMSRTINQEGKTVARKRGDEIKIRGVYTRLKTVHGMETGGATLLWELVGRIKQTSPIFSFKSSWGSVSRIIRSPELTRELRTQPWRGHFSRIVVPEFFLAFCSPESFSIDGFERFSRPVLFQMFVCVLPFVTKMRVYLRSILFLVKILIKKN